MKLIPDWLKLVFEALTEPETPRPPETLKCSKQWQFETNGQQPLKVGMRLIPMPSELWHQKGVCQHKVSIKISGLLNPCVGDEGHYIGDGAMNPATQKACEIIVKTVEAQIAQSLQGRGLLHSYALDVVGYKPATVFDHNSADDKILAIVINPCESIFQPPQYKPAKMPQIAALLSDVQDAIDKARPEIEAALTRDATKQPDPHNPAHMVEQQQRYRTGAKEAVRQFKGAQAILEGEPSDPLRLER